MPISRMKVILFTIKLANIKVALILTEPFKFSWQCKILKERVGFKSFCGFKLNDPILAHRIYVGLLLGPPTPICFIWFLLLCA